MEWRISTETEREEVRGGGGSTDTGSTGTDPQYLIVLRREGEHASMWRVGVPAVFGGQAISREKCSCRHLSIFFIACVKKCFFLIIHWVLKVAYKIAMNSKDLNLL